MEETQTQRKLQEEIGEAQEQFKQKKRRREKKIVPLFCPLFSKIYGTQWFIFVDEQSKEPVGANNDIQCLYFIHNFVVKIIVWKS